jgi:hypothetical protein
MVLKCLTAPASGHSRDYSKPGFRGAVGGGADDKSGRRGGAALPRYPIRVYTGRVAERGGTMRTAIICGALMALAITTASAQQSLFSANSVLPGCKAVFEEGRGLGRQDTGYCVGAINALVFLAPTECIEIPDNVTFLQILVVVGRFIEARPERMDDAFVGLAFEALLEAWPCRKTPGPSP